MTAQDETSIGYGLFLSMDRSRVKVRAETQSGVDQIVYLTHGSLKEVIAYAEKNWRLPTGALK